MADYEFKVTNLTNDLFKTDDEETSKEIKKFLNKQGNKAKKITLKIARAKVKKKTGNYHSRIKKGKVYKDDNNTWGVRVYSNAPHAHLIEDGHDVVRGGKKGKGGKVIGKAKGKKVLTKFEKDYANKFYKDCENLVDDLLEKGFSW
ncbi:HK97 gp10 family phage protein [[Clostridium] colinum]|uniref:HK97 gp10 family phage protein n=1 Tax=[Clostridium] colinum TaxID=36835 RepID=UPI0020258A57|nr:HK97 gp10 family phage protein [[Clostridium] colinum]